MRRATTNWLFFAFMFVLFVISWHPLQAMANEALDMLIDISGFILVVIGLYIRLLAHAWKLAHGGQGLVITGPYQSVRNPMYLGSLISGLGVCIILGSLLFFVFFTLTFVIVHHLIIRREEVFLQSHYHDDYSSYRDNVPRWIPNSVALLQQRGLTKQQLGVTMYREKSAFLISLLGALAAEVLADTYCQNISIFYHSELSFWLTSAATIIGLWLFLVLITRSRLRRRLQHS